MPHCRGRGGVPHKRTRAGGWEELRPPGAVTQRSPLGEGEDEGERRVRVARRTSARRKAIRLINPEQLLTDCYALAGSA